MEERSRDSRGYNSLSNSPKKLSKTESDEDVGSFVCHQNGERLRKVFSCASLGSSVTCSAFTPPLPPLKKTRRHALEDKTNEGTPSFPPRPTPPLRHLTRLSLNNLEMRSPPSIQQRSVSTAELITKSYRPPHIQTLGRSPLALAADLRNVKEKSTTPLFPTPRGIASYSFSASSTPSSFHHIDTRAASQASTNTIGILGPTAERPATSNSTFGILTTEEPSFKTGIFSSVPVAPHKPEKRRAIVLLPPSPAAPSPSASLFLPKSPSQSAVPDPTLVVKTPVFDNSGSYNDDRRSPRGQSVEFEEEDDEEVSAINYTSMMTTQQDQQDEEEEYGHFLNVFTCSTPTPPTGKGSNCVVEATVVPRHTSPSSPAEAPGHMLNAPWRFNIGCSSTPKSVPRAPSRVRSMHRISSTVSIGSGVALSPSRSPKRPSAAPFLFEPPTAVTGRESRPPLPAAILDCGVFVAAPSFSVDIPSTVTATGDCMAVSDPSTVSEPSTRCSTAAGNQEDNNDNTVAMTNDAGEDSSAAGSDVVDLACFYERMRLLGSTPCPCAPRTCVDLEGDEDVDD